MFNSINRRSFLAGLSGILGSALTRIFGLTRFDSLLEKQSNIVIDGQNEGSILQANHLRKQYLNKKYTFDNFIENENNKYAVKSALKVTESHKDLDFNPLLIYGCTGSGKTHLLHAIGNRIYKKQKNINIVLVTSEKFTCDYIMAIQKNKSVEFCKKYRAADILLIDDIQYFQHKMLTQEQLLHTFDELSMHGKQIVLTSDRLPSKMNHLSERLVCRFESGHLVHIHTTNFERTDTNQRSSASKKQRK